MSVYLLALVHIDVTQGHTHTQFNGSLQPPGPFWLWHLVVWRISTPRLQEPGPVAAYLVSTMLHMPPRWHGDFRVETLLSHTEYFAQKAQAEALPQPFCLYATHPRHRLDFLFEDGQKERWGDGKERGIIKGDAQWRKVPAGYFCLDVRK